MSHAIELKSWGSARVGLVLAPDSGRFRRKLLWRPHKTCAGFGVVYRGVVYALYREGENIYFQWGKRRATVSQAGVEVLWGRVDARQNSFEVRVQGGEGLELTYPSALTKRIAKLDPSFDALDEELEDFFLWTSRRVKDANWVAEALRGGVA